MQKELISMTKEIDFYFDIISPYTYIAHKKIQKINKNNKIKFNYKPILLGGLHKIAGITAPAFNKFKMKNMHNDSVLISKKNNFDFFWNNKFPINSLYIMRGYLFISENEKKNYLDVFMDAYWKNNLDLSDEKILIQLLAYCKIDSEKFFNGIKDQSIKDNLKKLTEEAFQKEVFGAPTFIVNNKLFWGQDRFEYALEELKIN
jgi:2-hydroxychromene-2-carboxylate isomerase